MLWCSAKIHYGKTHSPVDHDPNTFSDVRFFVMEVDALRHANATGGKAVKIDGTGDSLEDAWFGR